LYFDMRPLRERPRRRSGLADFRAGYRLTLRSQRRRAIAAMGEIDLDHGGPALADVACRKRPGLKELRGWLESFWASRPRTAP
jgi:hypothetical protein